MSPVQCKMARNGLGWSVHELAKIAKVRAATISSYERGGDALKSTIDKLKQALLETGHVRFEGETCVCVIKQGEGDEQ